MLRRILIPLAMVLTACSAAELRIDETKGVPSVSGSTTVDLGTYTCGDTLTEGDYTVHTSPVTGGCQFSFDSTVQVLQASDYQSIPEFKGAAYLVKRIELNIKKLDFTDGNGGTLSLTTQVTSANLIVNGQQVATKTDLANLPHVVELDGDSLTSLKAQIDNRQPASVAVKAVAVLPNDPPPPAKLGVSYEAQPAIILGPGDVKF